MRGGEIARVCDFPLWDRLQALGLRGFGWGCRVAEGSHFQNDVNMHETTMFCREHVKTVQLRHRFRKSVISGVQCFQSQGLVPAATGFPDAHRRISEGKQMACA